MKEIQIYFPEAENADDAKTATMEFPKSLKMSLESYVEKHSQASSDYFDHTVMMVRCDGGPWEEWGIECRTVPEYRVRKVKGKS